MSLGGGRLEQPVVLWAFLSARVVGLGARGFPLAKVEGGEAGGPSFLLQRGCRILVVSGGKRHKKNLVAGHPTIKQEPPITTAPYVPGVCYLPRSMPSNAWLPIRVPCCC